MSGEEKVLSTQVTLVGVTKVGSVSRNFGIKYQPDRGLARQDPKVIAEVANLQRTYALVSVRFSDTN
jgi:hypothetical protein